MKRALGIAAAALVAAGCAPPPYHARMGVLVPSPLMVYEGATGPLSHQAPTLRDGTRLVGETTGEACQSGLALPIGLAGLFTPTPAAPASIGVAWGDGGWSEAMKDAQKKAPGGRLVDVRADLHVTNILFVWRRQCLEIHAAVAR